MFHLTSWRVLIAAEGYHVHLGLPGVAPSVPCLRYALWYWIIDLTAKALRRNETFCLLHSMSVLTSLSARAWENRIYWKGVSFRQRNLGIKSRDHERHLSKKRFSTVEVEVGSPGAHVDVVYTIPSIIIT